MQHNNLDPFGQSPLLQIYGIILWICSISMSMANTAVHYDDSWVDITLEILSKLAPLVSTFFIYIINRKEIDRFFKERVRRKKR